MGSPEETGPTSFFPGISLCVTTVVTPSLFQTSVKSIFFINACALSLQPMAPYKIPLGSKISSVYFAEPLTCFFPLSCGLV